MGLLVPASGRSYEIEPLQFAVSTCDSRVGQLEAFGLISVAYKAIERLAAVLCQADTP